MTLAFSDLWGDANTSCSEKFSASWPGFRGFEGHACSHCSTQRQRCGEAWHHWDPSFLSKIYVRVPSERFFGDKRLFHLSPVRGSAGQAWVSWLRLPGSGRRLVFQILGVEMTASIFGVLPSGITTWCSSWVSSCCLYFAGRQTQWFAARCCEVPVRNRFIRQPTPVPGCKRRCTFCLGWDVVFLKLTRSEVFSSNSCVNSNYVHFLFEMSGGWTS